MTRRQPAQMILPFGTDEGDFIDAERCKMITFETESGDWSVAEGVVEERHISFVVSCYNQKIIQTLFSVSGVGSSWGCTTGDQVGVMGFSEGALLANSLAALDDRVQVRRIRYSQRKDSK